MLAQDWDDSYLASESMDNWLPSANDPDDVDLDVVAVESLFEMINTGQSITGESMRSAVVVKRESMVQ